SSSLVTTGPRSPTWSISTGARLNGAGGAPVASPEVTVAAAATAGSGGRLGALGKTGGGGGIDGRLLAGSGFSRTTGVAGRSGRSSVAFAPAALSRSRVGATLGRARATGAGRCSLR